MSQPVQWVSVGVYTGGGAVITYSYDGVNWNNVSNSNTLFTNRLSSVAHSGSVWVLGGWPYNAQGTIPPIGYSSDGITWNRATSSMSVFGTNNNGNQVHGVAWGNGKFVAVGRGTVNIAAYSSDGINWTGCYANTNTANYFTWVIYKNSTWVAGGSIGVYSSSDGITWTYKSSFQSNVNGKGGGCGLEWNGTYWVSSNMQYSSNLVNWTAASKPFSFTEDTCVKYNGTVIIAGGWGGTNGLTTSTNGTAWTSTSYTNVASSVGCIDYYQYTSTWILGQYSGGSTNGNQILYSTNGTTWNIASSNTFFGAGGYPLGIAPSLNSPYTVGTAPTITSITNGYFSFNVNFTAGTGASPAPTTYYYSLNGGAYTNANTTTSPILITGVNIATTYNVTIIANNLAGNTAASNIAVGFIPYPCFLEGSKILRFSPETYQDEYVPVETLRKGDLIATSESGYQPIHSIGYKTIPRPKSDPNPSNRLYKFSKKTCPSVFEPLYITGEHCTLHRNIPEDKRDRITEHMGDVYITEEYYRMPAFLDDRGEPYDGEDSPATIWHFALEHENVAHNYGVWANGLLVESCAIESLMEKSGMRLLE
jgi:hypothetical protein